MESPSKSQHGFDALSDADLLVAWEKYFRGMDSSERLRIYESLYQNLYQGQVSKERYIETRTSLSSLMLAHLEQGRPVILRAMHRSGGTAFCRGVARKANRPYVDISGASGESCLKEELTMSVPAVNEIAGRLWNANQDSVLSNQLAIQEWHEGLQREGKVVTIIFDQETGNPRYFEDISELASYSQLRFLIRLQKCPQDQWQRNQLPADGIVYSFPCLTLAESRNILCRPLEQVPLRITPDAIQALYTYSNGFHPELCRLAMGMMSGEGYDALGSANPPLKAIYGVEDVHTYMQRVIDQWRESDDKLRGIGHLMINHVRLYGFELSRDEKMLVDRILQGEEIDAATSAAFQDLLDWGILYPHPETRSLKIRGVLRRIAFQEMRRDPTLFDQMTLGKSK